jgi:hypothetical protein
MAVCFVHESSPCQGIYVVRIHLSKLDILELSIHVYFSLLTLDWIGT